METRKTSAVFNIVNGEITLAKTNPVFEQTSKYEDKTAMHKAMWYILHSPKLIEVNIISTYYSKDILSMIKYCEMVGLYVELHLNKDTLHTSTELQAWFTESQQTKEEWAIGRECIDLMVKHTPELLKYAKKSNDELIEVLHNQIYNSGYDVSMQSIFNQDGLNSGVYEDRIGKKHEWSRTYTKRYERYNTQLKDLLLMYINCKFYAQNNFEQDRSSEEITFSDERADAFKLFKLARERGYDVSLEEAKAYTSIYNMDLQDTVVVTPMSACSLGVQMKMN